MTAMCTEDETVCGCGECPLHAPLAAKLRGLARDYLQSAIGGVQAALFEVEHVADPILRDRLRRLLIEAGADLRGIRRCSAAASDDLSALLEESVVQVTKGAA